MRLRGRIGVAAISVLGAATALGATSASAATEFGDTCTGTSAVTAPYTLTTLAGAPSALPLTAPVSGVITQVKVRIGLPLPLAIPEEVKVIRPAGGNNYTTIAQTTVQGTTGLAAAAARMPVQAGDRLAIHGLPFSYMGTPYPGYEFICEGGAGDQLGIFIGDVPPGATAEYTTAPGARVPASAAIEPDADGDGFGDETQDACPQSAAVQVACPVVKLSTSTTVKKKQVTVILTSTTAAAVTVNGTVNLGKGQKAKVKVGPKTVNPGSFTKFKLKFPQKLIDRLKELAPSKALTMKIVSSAPNVAAGPTKKTVRVKLKGQG